MKKICVVTGSRAEYGLLKPIMNAIKENNTSVEKVRSFTDKYIEQTDNATKKIAEFVLSVGRIERD